MARKKAMAKPKQVLCKCELRTLKLYTRFDKKEIAALLGKSLNTVKAHLKNCIKKLHARHVRQAMYMATRMKLF